MRTALASVIGGLVGAGLIIVWQLLREMELDEAFSEDLADTTWQDGLSGYWITYTYPQQTYTSASGEAIYRNDWPMS